jgi:hypothetical protein
MRAFVLGSAAAACAFLALPAQSAPMPSASDMDLARIDGRQDHWQGRRHYLYDEENQPGRETVGATPSDARACVQRPVRLKRSDGTTVVRRLTRCD